MKHSITLLFLLLFFLVEPIAATAQKRDKQGNLKGRQTFYYDKEKTQKWMKGRFKDGMEVGKWYKWDMQGNLEEIKRYKKNHINVVGFHPNGKRSWKGKAYLEITDEKFRYFWSGPWKRYDINGKYVETIIYSNGLPEGEVIQNDN
jgi:antitoxin component YwqK of YwqJK toxin-antitoxin module